MPALDCFNLNINDAQRQSEEISLINELNSNSGTVKHLAGPSTEHCQYWMACLEVKREQPMEMGLFSEERFFNHAATWLCTTEEEIKVIQNWGFHPKVPPLGKIFEKLLC